jgi:hypothetical protein
MNHPIRLKTTAPPLLMTITLFYFGLSTTAKALLPAPSPDGGYPGGNTAEGINALHDVNTAVGINNTAVGDNALTHNTTGGYNVAIGARALASNTAGSFNMAVGTEVQLGHWFSSGLQEHHRQAPHWNWRCRAPEQQHRQF